MLATRRFATLFALALAAVMLTSCADDHAPPTAPIAPNPSLLGDVVGGVTGTVGDLANGLGLVRCNVRTTHSASALIGPQGGTLRVGPHLHQPGFTPGCVCHGLQCPADARPTWLSASAMNRKLRAIVMLFGSLS